MMCSHLVSGMCDKGCLQLAPRRRQRPASEARIGHPDSGVGRCLLALAGFSAPAIVLH